MDGVKEMHSKDKIVVYLATRNYYKYLLSAVTSLVTNTDVDAVYLLIEDNIFPYKLPDNVRTLNVSQQPFFDKFGPNYNKPWSYMVLLKIALPFIFPEYNKLLVLDVDTIVDDDISEMWDIQLDGYCFAAVKELHKSTSERNYYNAGVLLMNCERLVETGICSNIIRELNTNSYDFCEQDCINYMYNDEILEIPSCYNVNLFSEVPNEKKIIHFAAIQNWENRILYQKYLEKYNEVFG